MNLLDHLVDTAHALAEHTWRPSRAVAFVVRQPKAREILAADFSDRVVHHLLVPRLERQFEPVFIDDSFSNRVGKGTHAAVARLQEFLRCVSAVDVERRQAGAYGEEAQDRRRGLARAGTSEDAEPDRRRGLARAGLDGDAKRRQGGAFLQLDIANFFNSIDRRRLFGFIRNRLEKDVRRRPGRPRHLPQDEADEMLWLTRVLLSGNAAEGAHLRGRPEEFACVPPHKRLINAPPERGLPIGNLTSQFFANVYLNELDQFVKHELKCRHYVRYVDDFVLVHEDPRQLAAWRDAIVRFLDARLGLALRDAGRLRPVSDGIDFLGYVVRRDYMLARRRVVVHCRQKLAALEGRMVRLADGGWLRHYPAGARDELRAVMASYLGHFRHASCHRLVKALWARSRALGDLFVLTPQGGLAAAWQPRSVTSLASQWRYFSKRRAGELVLMQVGNRVEAFADDAATLAAALGTSPDAAPRAGTKQSLSLPLALLDRILARLRRRRVAYCFVAEEGYLKRGMKRRVLRSAWSPGTPPGERITRENAS